MDADQSGLLIAALVAIVAVVGLVILFSGANTGAALFSKPTVSQTGLCECPSGYQPQFTGRGGGLAQCTCHKQDRVPSWYKEVNKWQKIIQDC